MKKEEGEEDAFSELVYELLRGKIQRRKKNSEENLAKCFAHLQLRRIDLAKRVVTQYIYTEHICATYKRCKKERMRKGKLLFCGSYFELFTRGFILGL